MVVTAKHPHSNRCRIVIGRRSLSGSIFRTFSLLSLRTLFDLLFFSSSSSSLFSIFTLSRSICHCCIATTVWTQMPLFVAAVYLRYFSRIDRKKNKRIQINFSWCVRDGATWIKQILNFNHKFPHCFPFVVRAYVTRSVDRVNGILAPGERPM